MAANSFIQKLIADLYAKYSITILCQMKGIDICHTYYICWIYILLNLYIFNCQNGFVKPMDPRMAMTKTYGI